MKSSDPSRLNDLVKWFKDDRYLKADQEEFNNNFIDKSFVEVNTKLVNGNMLYSELKIYNINYRDSAVYKCLYEGVQEKSIVTVLNQSKNFGF